jgi:hypothetical protein
MAVLAKAAVVVVDVISAAADAAATTRDVMGATTKGAMVVAVAVALGVSTTGRREETRADRRLLRWANR